jgi:diaminopimelate epimerase
MPLKFTKMHGIGNDYVYVNGFTQNVAVPSKTAVAIADRHYGVGSDGLILLLPPTAPGNADVRMRMFNADGSEGEMCGNGVRCVAKYAWDHGLAKTNPMCVETGRGVLSLALKLNGRGKVEQVTVNMDQPILEAADIPVRLPGISATDKVIDYSIVESGIANSFTPELELMRVELGVQRMTCVSMGNPHVVIYCAAKLLPLEKFGPVFERHPVFPKRINVHFAQVISPTEVLMRTWERGSGITLACGTGACAVCVAGVLTGRTDRKILTNLPGGDLTIEWRESDNNLYMTGPATEVFSGEWPD